MADFDKLCKTAAELSEFTLPSYDALPDIELYMDQLTGYLNKLLGRTCRSEDGVPLTPNRVNNYVKDGRIKRPVQKKYDRERIAMLYMLCCTKQNLTLPEASALLSMLEKEDTAALYEEFRALQEPIVQKCAAELAACEQNEEQMLKKALELTLRSTAERFVAEAIISSLWHEPTEKKEKPKKEKKQKSNTNNI
ncbi:MAG: DUF1836 domain-containing protein [Clostridia bacterium]|nr:DUF1836 domain-containing protein [Clostridia bacterium]